MRRRDEDSDEGVERRQETVKDDHRVHREGRRGEVSKVFSPVKIHLLALSMKFTSHPITTMVRQGGITEAGEIQGGITPNAVTPKLMGN